jgi:ATP adenylyltransferase
LNKEQLWAPWRLAYITGDIDKQKPTPKELALLPGADPQCFICRAVADDRDRENLLVHRGTHMVTVLNRYPYNNGHLLVAPRLHKGRLDELVAEEHSETMQTITRFVSVLAGELNAEGFNVGLNMGRVAGAGLPGHLHWHIVPRWSGDTNFMPVLSGVDVISQSLDALWELLVEKLGES